MAAGSSSESDTDSGAVEVGASRPGLEGVGILPKLVEPFKQLCSQKGPRKEAGSGTEKRPTTVGGEPWEQELWQALVSGQDVLDTRETLGNFPAYQRLYALHAVQHVLANRKSVLRGNERVARFEKKLVQDDSAAAAPEEQESCRASTGQAAAKPQRRPAKKAKRSTGGGCGPRLPAGVTPPLCQDQGFTRPSVLILLPMRNAAFEVIQAILTLATRGTVEKQARFLEDFGGPLEDQEGDLEAAALRQEDDDGEPTDGTSVLFRGNVDDAFRIGIQWTGKTVKLYAPFYHSDILVASPLGLRTIIGAAGDEARDYDFLSSISLLIMDQADLISMQNWDHVTHTFQHLNLLPKTDHGTDFSRVKEVYLEGKGATVRQTCCFARYPFPDLNALLSRHCKNDKGVTRLTTPLELLSASINDVQTPIPVAWLRAEVTSPLDAADCRFTCFTDTILPDLRTDSSGHHIAIFMSSYFEFLRLKKYLTEREIPFAAISEYCTGPQVSAARSSFYNGHVPLLLVTERYFFFKRHHIRGIEQLIFYSLPQEASFFAYWVNAMEEASLEGLQHGEGSRDNSNSPVLCLFDRLDALKLTRIVGVQRTSQLLASLKLKNVFASH